MRAFASTTRTSDRKPADLFSLGPGLGKYALAPAALASSVFPIQRKASCACGGGCPSCQAKDTGLKVSHPNDAAEIEADRTADKVMRMPEPPVTGARPGTGNVNAGPKSNPLTLYPKRSVDSGAGPVKSRISNRLGSQGNNGSAMDPGTRGFFEPRFEADLGHVRIHTGSRAAELSSELSARAFTIGSDIYFNEGQYQPSSESGKHLLAHELAHTLQQNGNDGNVIRRKCDVDRALKYYKTEAGQKISYSNWLEKMRKVAGTANKPLYEDASTAGKIDRSFVLLACKVQQLLNIGEDGMLGNTTAAAFENFRTGGKKGIDYSRLFDDKKLEIAIAIGAEITGEFAAVVSLLKKEEKKVKNFSSTDPAGQGERKFIKFTKDFRVPGDNTAAPVPIDVEINLIGEKSKEPKEAYTEFLSQKEIVIYSGHARKGTSTDFDAEKSPKENFIIGVNSALHKAGKLQKGYNSQMNKILEGYGNDLEAMSKAGKIDPDKYQVWFFNACSTINYLDEVRGGLVTDKSGKIKSKANLRFVGTTHSIYSDPLKIIESILNMKSMDEIIKIMDANEKEVVKKEGETVQDSYYFSD
jgi:hypothetical protein